MYKLNKARANANGKLQRYRIRACWERHGVSRRTVDYGAQVYEHDDVEDMLDTNELSERFFEDEDDGQPTWEQEWADFGESYE